MKHIKPRANIDGWVQTDEMQFVKKINDNVFKIYDEFIYGDNNEFVDIFYGTIDLSEYTNDEINDYTESYYKNIEEVKDIYGNDWRMIVAEFIAEQSSHHYGLDDFKEIDEL